MILHSAKTNVEWIKVETIFSLHGRIRPATEATLIS